LEDLGEEILEAFTEMEFDSHGLHASDYVMDGNFEKTPDDPNDWNWNSLNYSGYTYVSPESLEQSLKEYREKKDYFLEGSFHHICNNSFDFVHWCLTILNIDNGIRLVPPSKIDIQEDNYVFKNNLKNNIKSVSLLATFEEISNDKLSEKYYKFEEAIQNHIKRKSYSSNDYFKKLYEIQIETCISYIGTTHTIRDIKKSVQDKIFKIFNKLFR